MSPPAHQWVERIPHGARITPNVAPLVRGADGAARRPYPEMRSIHGLIPSILVGGLCHAVCIRVHSWFPMVVITPPALNLKTDPSLQVEQQELRAFTALQLQRFGLLDGHAVTGF